MITFRGTTCPENLCTNFQPLLRKLWSFLFPISIQMWTWTTLGEKSHQDRIDRVAMNRVLHYSIAPRMHELITPISSIHPWWREKGARFGAEKGRDEERKQKNHVTNFVHESYKICQNFISWQPAASRSLSPTSRPKKNEI